MGGGGGGLGGALGGAGLGGAILGPAGSLIGGMMGSRGGGGGAADWNGPQMTRPEFVSLLDPKTGLMKEQYQTKWGPDVTADQRGLNAIRDKALSAGPSAWANQATAQQKLEEKGLKSATQQQGASAEAQARSAMASKFGLSPAAQARLATQNMRFQMSGLQGVGQQGALARGNIGLQDEQMKNQFLSQLPQQDLAQANLALQNKTGNLQNQQWNIGNATNQTALKNAADLATYNKQMEIWAAQKSGDNIRQSGGGSGKGGGGK